MYKNILIPIALDHGHDTNEALSIARKLRAKGGVITLLHVVEQLPGYVVHYLPIDQTEKNLAEAKHALQTEIGDATDIAAKIITGHAGSSITEYAVKIEADCIVMASHRPGVQDFFLGSTAARVVRHAPCSVHVLR